MNGKQYEKFVKEEIIRKISCDLSTSSEPSTKKWRGQSGYNHQIDISLEQTGNDGKRYIHLFECKCYRRKVGLAEVLIMASRVIDISKANSKCYVTGAMVTTEGYTKPAKTFADGFGLEINVVQGNTWSIKVGNKIIWNPKEVPIHIDCEMVNVHTDHST